MKKKYLILIIATFLMCAGHPYAQSDYEPGLLWLTPTSPEVYPDSRGQTDISAVNTLFSQYGVYEYEQVMPFAKTPSLREVYQLRFSGNDSLLKQEIEQNFAAYYEKVRRIPVPTLVYDPYDEFWRYQVSNFKDWMWHLERIDASNAWDITKGSANIKIAVSDRGFDLPHPDLKEKIYPPYNVKKLYVYDSLHPDAGAHGTAVASFAAAATGTETKQNGGSLVSIGNKSMIYATSMNRESCLYVSTVLDCDVLNISWIDRNVCEGDETGYDSLIVKEILDNGTVITAAAGNGFCGSCYNGNKWAKGCEQPADFNFWSTPYPFSPKYDERIICVSGTDSLDYLTYIVYPNTDSSYDATWSYFKEVDVCAPGHNLMGAGHTRIFDTLGNIVPSKWPYYGANGGTSFATPIVAGLAALIKSLNPCFTPAEVEYFIKSTTDPVADAHLYEDAQGNSQTGTGRINAQAALEMAQLYANNAEVHIYDNVVWTEDTTVSSIFVHDGGQLTIQSQVTFVHDTSGIIVDVGGRLIVDGGYLTSCGLCWKGIEVWGNPDTTQYFTDQQGYLAIKNGSTIENSLYGAIACRLEDYRMTGGIIQGDDSYFLNNVSSIEFAPYDNMHPYDPGNELDNLSRFNNCVFEIDNPKVYYHTKLEERATYDHNNAMVRLVGVQGIDFKGCEFYNKPGSTVVDTNIHIDDYYMGILAFDTEFSVLELCTDNYEPCENYKRSIFKNLRYGVKAFSYEEPNYIEVSNADIERCKTGIYLSGTTNSSIHSNSIQPRSIDEFQADSTYFKDEIFAGIYLDGCTGYFVEENTIFERFSMGNPYYNIGIVVNNSGSDENEIYNNTIENLYVGILAQNQNRGLKGEGLCLKCNDMDDNEYDIAITGDAYCELIGIARYQGSAENDVTAPANNTFTNSTKPYSDIYNGGERIDYYYTNDLVDEKLEPHWISPGVYKALNYQPYNKPVSCPSSFGSGGSSGEIKSEISSLESDLDTQTAELNMLVDGGNTESLNTEVQTSTPPEAVELQEQLISDSPYLSDTVMKSAIYKENVLPNAMIRDILVSNPQSAKSDEVLNELDNRFDPMPDYMMNQIMQGNNILSVKEKMEGKIADVKLQRHKSYRDIINYYRKDTSGLARDSLIYWMDRFDKLHYEYALAFEYLKEGNITAMNTVLNEIPSSYDLSGDLLLTHTDYLSFFSIMSDLKSQGKTIKQATQAQIDTLLMIAGYDDQFPGIYARNALLALEEIIYNEPYILPGELKASTAEGLPDDITEMEEYLKVFPNPAKDYVIIEYATDEGYKASLSRAAILMIYTAEGKAVASKDLQHAQDQVVISTQTWKAGNYICKINYSNNSSKSIKFTIVK